MDDKRIQELATLEATIGLRGADLREFDLWWPTASRQERALFAQTIDLITMISLSQTPSTPVPGHLKAKVMAAIEDRPTLGKPPTPDEAAAANWPPGYAFTMNFEGEWRELPNRGVRIKELACSAASGTATFLLEMDPGAKLLSHHHRGAEEAYVLHGDLQMRGKVLRTGDHMRAEPGTRHQDLYSQEGCRALIFTTLENYPRRAIRSFDRVHRLWRRCRRLFPVSGGRSS